jgi:hypothetical protein
MENAMDPELPHPSDRRTGRVIAVAAALAAIDHNLVAMKQAYEYGVGVIII